jgi:DNA invertase Pin-like site-specific DNA recombinase
MHVSEKIEATHLKRKAILYIRQSTMRQVMMNTESTIRQYALKGRLIDLGWDEARIEVIDCDLGRSGADMTQRDGFRQMLADVGEGCVGVIACIEASRLSRSSGDWGRLMEICALSGTILIDDDGIYDPNSFNDRLLLGLKGTMSEAELHFLRERMRGGALNKANRGELRSMLPVGYLYDEAGRVIKDPDLQIQDAIRLFFESFHICGSGHKLAVYYSEKGYLFPANKNRGFGNPDICWDVLTPGRAIGMLHSPTYAGAYTYGRVQLKNTVRGKKYCVVPEERWISNIANHHEAYITPEEYRANLATLRSNCTRSGASPPREGKALLQGVALCSRCGNKMYLNYSNADHWQYLCKHRPKGAPYQTRWCLQISGAMVDAAVSEIVLRSLTPEAVKAADEVMRELEKRKHNEGDYFTLQVDKARYEANLARKRYMNADPENRLVSAELERLWNESMNRLAEAEVNLRKNKAMTKSGRTKTDMESLVDLPEKLRDAWLDNALSIVDKKRVVRCLVEDVALNRVADEIHIGIRFKGGLTESVILPRPLLVYEKVATCPETVEYIKEASKKYRVDEIAESLNLAGKKTGKGQRFTGRKVFDIQKRYEIPSLIEYLRASGYLSTTDKAKQLGISPAILGNRRREGDFVGKCIKTSNTGYYMFEP